MKEEKGGKILWICSSGKILSYAIAKKIYLIYKKLQPWIYWVHAPLQILNAPLKYVKMR